MKIGNLLSKIIIIKIIQDQDQDQNLKIHIL
jgi:hypothetical protein